MSRELSYQNLKTRLAALGRERDQMAMMLKATRTIPLSASFDQSARSIYDFCKSLIGASCGYVTLLSEDGSENEVLFLDDGGLPFSGDPNLPMPVQGLRSAAYSSGEAVYENNFMTSEWIDLMPKGHIPLDNVMFAPLNMGKKTIGVIGLANKPTGFTDQDKKTAESFADIAILALKHGRLSDELREKEKLHRKILENISDSVLITDRDGFFTYICPNTQLIFGFSFQEIQSLNTIINLLGKPIFNDQELDEKQEIHNIPVEISDKNRQTRFLLATVKKVSIGMGTILYTFRDITEKKISDQKREESEQKFRRTFYQAPIGAALVSLDFKFLKVNQEFCRIVGYRAEELLKLRFPDITHPDDLKKDVQSANDLAQGLIDQYQMDKRYIRKNKDSIWVRLSVRLIKDSAGEPLFYLPMIQDINDWIKQAEEIQEKQSELTMHAAKLEEMNTALNVMIEHRYHERQKREDEIIAGFKKLIFPYFDHSIKNKSREEIALIFDILNRNIREVLFKGNKSTEMMYRTFTPLEVQVADLIKQNRSTKEIANILQTSVRTVYFHRENIRKKLNLAKNKTNLKTFLQTSK